MNRVLEYIIKAKDETQAAVKGAVDRVKGMAASIGKNLMNIKAGWDMLKGGVQVASKAIWSALQESFKFEMLRTKFQTLIGDVDQTKAHMQDLKELGDTPPFSLEEMAKASQSMMALSGGAIGFKQSLVMVGDAAAATGNSIEQVGDAVGRAYAIIRDGQPLSRATMQLRNMGVITPAVAAELDEMQRAGKSNIEIWEALEDSLKKYNGAMEATEATGQGLVDEVQTQWTNIVRGFGDAFVETSKDGLGVLLEKMKELQEDGTLAVWANKLVESLKTAKDAAKGTGKALAAIYKYSGLSDVVAGIKGAASAVGTLAGGGSLKDAMKAMDQAGAGGFYGQKVREMWDPFESLKEREKELAAIQKKDDEIREKYKAEQQKKRMDSETLETVKREKLVEDMRKAASEKAKKDLIAAAKKAEEERHKEAIKNTQNEIQQYAKNRSEAEDRLSRARSAVEQAIGWYRDPESYKRYKEGLASEEMMNQRLERDLANLEKRQEWMSYKEAEGDDVLMAIKQAREEEAKAQDALKAIEENTAGLAKKLEDLLAIKE